MKKSKFSYWSAVLLICGVLAIIGFFIDLHFDSVNYSDNIIDENYGNGVGFMFALSIISLFLIVSASIYSKIKFGMFYDKSAVGLVIIIAGLVCLIGLAIYTGHDIYHYFFVRESY